MPRPALSSMRFPPMRSVLVSLLSSDRKFAETPFVWLSVILLPLITNSLPVENAFSTWMPLFESPGSGAVPSPLFVTVLLATVIVLSSDDADAS